WPLLASKLRASKADSNRSLRRPLTTMQYLVGFDCRDSTPSSLVARGVNCHRPRGVFTRVIGLPDQGAGYTFERPRWRVGSEQLELAGPIYRVVSGPGV